jgi:hypothetical protein
MSGSITLPLPANSHVKMTGFTNTGGWGEQITIQPPGGQKLTWSSTGPTNDKVIGQSNIGPFPKPNELVVTMAYNSGHGFQASAIEAHAFNHPGLSGYVVGGQDGGGRPHGPAFTNTVLLVYWATGY